MKVCGIIVTYGDRFKYLIKVVDELLRQGIDKIIIINNGSAAASLAQLSELAAKYPSIVTLSSFDQNKGSAKGFNKGLALAKETFCDFIWILDDDNLPAENALNELKQFWKARQAVSGDKLAALASLRRDRSVFMNALEQRKPGAFLWPVNSFAGFHIGEIFQKFKERIGVGKKASRPEEFTPLQLEVGFYGGLFFPIALLEKVEMPREDLVLYSDDLIFTRGISSSNREIWLIPSSIVYDIDMPFYIAARKGFLYHSSLDGPNDGLVFYATRNSVYYISRYLVSNRFLYSLNKVVFMLFITIAGLLRGKMARLKLIYEAIRNGEHGFLGEHPVYKLDK